MSFAFFQYEYNSPSGAINPSSSSSGGGGRKSSIDALGGGGPGGIDFMGTAGDTIGSLGGMRASGFSPGHGASMAGLGGTTTFGSSAFLGSGTCQWVTRGIIEYLIRSVLNTL